MNGSILRTGAGGALGRQKVATLVNADQCVLSSRRTLHQFSECSAPVRSLWSSNNQELPQSRPFRLYRDWCTSVQGIV